MGVPRILAVATATPPHRFDQATLLRIAGYDDALRSGFFTNSQIDGRYLYLDPETFRPNESVDEMSARFRRGAADTVLEGAEPFVYRDQFDDRGPTAHKVLEQAFHPAEGVNNLLHDTESDHARNQGRSEGDIGNQSAELQIGIPGHVKIHVMKEQTEVIPPHIGEQGTEPRRAGPFPVVLAVDELLAERRLDALILEL